MKKDEFIKELNESAVKKARVAKKSKQLLFLLTLLIIILLLGFTLIYLKPFPSHNEVFSSVLFFICGFMSFAGLVFLPFGTVSEEEIEKQFQKILTKAIEDHRNELENISKRKTELEKEIQTLEEIYLSYSLFHYNV